MPKKSNHSFSALPDTRDIRDRIVEAALPDVPFDGWVWDLIEKSSVKSGFDADMAAAVFPGRMADVLDHFAEMADRWMLQRLETIDPDDLRVRDRVKTAVLLRLRSLYPWREAVRQSASFWALPARMRRAGKITWRTADHIWRWAGDQSEDYNFYTKRTLLCGVLVPTLLAWLDDDSQGMTETEAFLDRRIESVMTLGKAVGKLKSFRFIKKRTGQAV